MTSQNSTAQRHNPLAVAFHWLTALLVVAQISLALRAWKLPPGAIKNALLGQHMSVGLCILTLTLLRLLWRSSRGVPALPPTVGAAARRTARINQALLYLLLVALPLSGWSMLSAAGVPVSLFGTWSLPALLSPDEATLKSLKLVHLTLNTLLFAALLLHVAAAVRHGFLSDGVLARMLPRFGRGAGS